jgi:hypothetical protein
MDDREERPPQFARARFSLRLREPEDGRRRTLRSSRAGADRGVRASWTTPRVRTAVITGVHAIVFAHDAERARAFFRDTLGFDSVDAGGGWLIFALPPAELAAHPTDQRAHHELYLMCDDVRATVAGLKRKGVEFTSEIAEERWGLTTTFEIPGGAR